ncbi:MAG: hypothetical protein MZV64_48620 [Ignavibacteriales bacterium]|nr:hypothetical protein [Ignavibacteriales bacterium]
MCPLVRPHCATGRLWQPSVAVLADRRRGQLQPRHHDGPRLLEGQLGAPARQHRLHQPQPRDTGRDPAELESRRQPPRVLDRERHAVRPGRDAHHDAVAARRPVLDRVGPQLVHHQRQRHRLAFRAGRERHDSGGGGSKPDLDAEHARQRGEDPLRHAEQRQGAGGSDLQAVHLRDGLDLPRDLGQRDRDLGLAVGHVLARQSRHALQVVLDAVVHLAHEDVALLDGFLHPLLFRARALRHVVGDPEHPDAAVLHAHRVEPAR